MNKKKKESWIRERCNNILDSKQFKSTILVLLLIVFFGGYTIFFTSPLFMPDNKTELRLTELNVANQLDSQHSFTIVRWQYSELQKRMEIEIDVNNTAYDGMKSYKYAVRSQPSARIKVNPIIENNSLLILQLDNISKNFDFISFQISLPDSSAEPLKLYTNKLDVEQVDRLDVKTEEEYNIDRLYRNIETYQKNIAQIRSEIGEIEKKINFVEQETKELLDSRQFKTESEIQEIDLRINTNNQVIEDENKNLDKLRQSILEYQNKITLIQEQIESSQ